MHNTFQFLRERIRRLLIIYRQFTSRFVSALRLGRTILEVIAFVASVVCITAMIVYVGFDHNHTTLIHIRRVLKGCQILFLVNIVYCLLFTFKETRRENRPVKWTVDTAMLVTLLPLCYPHPEHPWIPILEKVLYSGKMLMVLLMVYSMVTVSFGIMKMLNRRTNPSLILSASFLIFIFIGSFLLMMPRCTVGGIDYIDSLFVSTSSVCITGLTPVDVSQTFTPLGLLVIAVMIQAGGLGIMTFTSFFALFFSGNASIYNQLMVRDFIYAKSMSSLLPTLLYIFMATVAIELAGAVAIFLSIHGTLGMSLSDELIFQPFTPSLHSATQVSPMWKEDYPTQCCCIATTASILSSRFWSSPEASGSRSLSISKPLLSPQCNTSGDISHSARRYPARHTSTTLTRGSFSQHISGFWGCQHCFSSFLSTPTH